MILIADSGSTTTDWALRLSCGENRFYQTSGINPLLQKRQEILHSLKQEKTPLLAEANAVTALYFYGAGCTPEAAMRMQPVLTELFPHAQISIESDLLGAARALYGEEAGIAAILGTGSNTGFYNGKKITEQVPALGFILGDEGSGSYLGKRFLSDLLKNQLSQTLKEQYFHQTHLTQAEIIHRVYSEPYPNRFLASVAPFLRDHKEMREVQDLLIDCFQSFIIRNIQQYKYLEYPVSIVGSIAYYFQHELESVAKSLQIEFKSIQKSPLKGLILYHTTHL